MSPRLAPVRPIPWPKLATSSAFAALGARDPRSALEAAEREVSRAPRCLCCISPRAHLAAHIGTTLFLDDDPEKLRDALPADERASWTPRLLAALIVLHGRARVDLFARA